MRVTPLRVLTLTVVLANIVVVYLIFRLFLSQDLLGEANPITEAIKRATKSPTKHVSKLITLVLRQFELYENDVTSTVKSFINVFPSIQILVLFDSSPYPPLQLLFWNSKFKNIKLINLSSKVNVSYVDQYPLSHVKTKYVLFIPDSVRLPNRQTLQLLLSEIIKESDDIIVAPVGGRKHLNCLKVDLSIRAWMLQYSVIKNFTCDAVSGRHVTLLETDLLRKLPNAFLLPFPQSLYLQTAAINVKVRKSS